MSQHSRSSSRSTRMSCRHKRNRRLQRQQLMRAELRDAVIDSLSVETITYTNKVEEPQSQWLDEYIKTVRSDSGNNSNWDRAAYKPQKYQALKADPTSSKISQQIPEVNLLEPKKRYHHCEKHGLVPVPTSTGSASYTANTDNSEDSFYRGHNGADFSELASKLMELGKKAVEFAHEYPRLVGVLAGLLFIWWLSYQIDIWLSYLAAALVRLLHPPAHWWAVYTEQFAIRLRSFAATSDDLVESYYCDFSRSWCTRFDLMCDVHCSFVDKAIERIRAHP